MDGAALREWRTSRGLYQQGLADALTLAGVEIDQPTVSEIERGKLPMPDAVRAAIESGAVVAPEPVADVPAPPAARARPQGRRRRPPAAATPPPIEPGEPEPAPPPEPASVPPADGSDVAPRPLAAPADPTTKPTATPWSPAARSQLEKDLRKLFAGETFLVPVPMEDGTTAHHEAFIPGLAQIVGFADAYDGRVIELNADAMAKAWADLADESPRVRRILMLLTYGGAWRGVIATTLPVLYSIGVHHGLIPPVLGGAAAAPQPEPVDAVPAL